MINDLAFIIDAPLQRLNKTALNSWSIMANRAIISYRMKVRYFHRGNCIRLNNINFVLTNTTTEKPMALLNAVLIKINTPNKKEAMALIL